MLIRGNGGQLRSSIGIVILLKQNAILYTKSGLRRMCMVIVLVSDFIVYKTDI